MIETIQYTLLAFLSGSIPFAVLVGRALGKVDPRTVGDGNPGAANVWTSAGWKIGLVAVALDIGKGFLPVYVAQRAGLQEGQMLPVALAPILGHAFQPFLPQHRGKALAASGGVWLALTGLSALLIFATGTLPVLLLQTSHAYAVFGGFLALILFFFAFEAPTWLRLLLIANTAVVLWTHRREIGRPWQWRPWVNRLFAWRSNA